MVRHLFPRHQAVLPTREPVDTAFPQIELSPGEARDNDGDGAFETRECLTVVYVGVPDIASRVGMGLPNQHQGGADDAR